VLAWELEENGKTVYDYKRRLDYFETDKDNKDYLVASLKDVFEKMNVEFDENATYTKKELIEIENKLTEEKEAIINIIKDIYANENKNCKQPENM
jgi:hypothetical protein